jgi:hypothetical protein
MDPVERQDQVRQHIAALADEATAERLARVGRSGRARAVVGTPTPHRIWALRTALGQRLIALGEAVAAVPLPSDDPCPDGARGRA